MSNCYGDSCVEHLWCLHNAIKPTKLCLTRLHATQIHSKTLQEPQKLLFLCRNISVYAEALLLCAGDVLHYHDTEQLL